MTDNKKEKFNLFNLFNRDGKGVDKDDDIDVFKNPGFKTFFILLGRKLSRLFSVNLFYVFGNFPLFFALIALAGYTSETSISPASDLYTVLKGTMYFNASPLIASLNGIFGIQAKTIVSSTATYVLYALALLVIFTFGPVNTGCTYLIRNMIRCEPIFMWSDFWYALKKNLKQSIPFGILDLFISVMLVYDMYWFKANMADGGFITALYIVSCAMIVMYFFMRMYIYLMMITFDLSILKLIKNAVFFAALGIKRNIVCLLATALIVGINYMLFIVLMPIGIILPFIITISLCSFVSIYCAFPKIKQIMIDPYYKEEKNTEE